MAITALKRQKALPSDLVNLETDWGVSVSEVAAQKTPLMKALAVAGYFGILSAAFLMIPILAGLTFFELTRGALLEIGIILGMIGVAIYLQVQSRKGPKNALQIDYDASEVRLGSITTAGAFVRHKVCALRSIEKVSVDASDPQSPALQFEMVGETATVRFSQSNADRLAELAAKVQSAADEARAAPIRSRIASKINGVEAGVREVSRRINSRVRSSFA